MPPNLTEGLQSPQRFRAIGQRHFFDDGADGKTPNKTLFGESIEEDQVTMEAKEIPEMMTKPPATVWVANPTDKPMENVDSLKEAKELARLYGTMSVTNGVTNEYFRTNYIRPTAWEQLRQRFNFDMGEIREIIWKRWTDDAAKRSW
jgi:hypothetical protein